MPSKPTSSKPRSSATSAAGNPADTLRGTGGELQQQAGGPHPTMTTAQGIPLADNQNSLRPAPRGPTLLEDFILREKITHFDHERIPERIVHARGSAAHGHFELTASLEKYTPRRSSPRRQSARRCSAASPPWPVAQARWIRRATCAASP